MTSINLPGRICIRGNRVECETGTGVMRASSGHSIRQI